MVSLYMENGRSGSNFTRANFEFKVLRHKIYCNISGNISNICAMMWIKFKYKMKL